MGQAITYSNDGNYIIAHVSVYIIIKGDSLSKFSKFGPIGIENFFQNWMGSNWV